MAKDITKFKDFKVKLNYSKILKKYGEKTVNTLHDISPSSNRPGRKTPYKDGWIAQEGTYRTGERVTVWNRTNWQLTHLLENGHFITNRRGGIAWSSPQPHIRPTFEKFKPRFISEMRKVEITTIIK